MHYTRTVIVINARLSVAGIGRFGVERSTAVVGMTQSVVDTTKSTHNNTHTLRQAFAKCY